MPTRGGLVEKTLQNPQQDGHRPSYGTCQQVFPDLALHAYHSVLPILWLFNPDHDAKDLAYVETIFGKTLNLLKEENCV